MAVYRLIISIITYMFWGFLPQGSFYIGNALFISLLCTYLYFRNMSSNIKFILFSLSLNNLFDELFFDNTKLGINELLTAVGILIILVIRIRNDRKKSRFV